MSTRRAGRRRRASPWRGARREGRGGRGGRGGRVSVCVRVCLGLRGRVRVCVCVRVRRPCEIAVELRALQAAACSLPNGVATARPQALAGPRRPSQALAGPRRPVRRPSQALAGRRRPAGPRMQSQGFDCLGVGGRNIICWCPPVARALYAGARPWREHYMLVPARARLSCGHPHKCRSYSKEDTTRQLSTNHGPQRNPSHSCMHAYFRPRLQSKLHINCHLDCMRLPSQLQSPIA